MLFRNVQVTLGILAALIEKSPRDVALIAPCVLKILDLILRSSDITMIESSLPAFEAFCEHHDVSSLFADQDYTSQYESVVRSYAALASIQEAPAGKAPLSRPVHARWRNAGLKAIKSIAASETLASVTGRQIDVIVPPILENLWTYEGDFIDVLLQRLEIEEKVDSEKLLRRRTSVGTVGTVDTAGDTHPAAFSGSTNDADRAAEEEISLLAMQCLKSIFVLPNRAQINAATAALLKFVLEKARQGENIIHLARTGKEDSGWAIAIYNVISRWAPVQDRYVILVVAMETLVRNPIKDDKLDQQIALVAIIGSLLRSDVNFIGLSVMDVLLGLVRQMKKLLQPTSGLIQGESVADEKVNGADADGASPQRRLLLQRLEQCIGDLATHVYYADQISDMIAAIVSRLKPSRSSSASSTPQGEKTEGQEPGPGASVADLAESQSGVDANFSYSQGRVCALKVIKAILLVANPKTKISGNMDLSRNRVPLHVWEGTQWLLRDPDGEVRKTYIDALGTWLDRETTPADLIARDETLVRNRSMKNSRELYSPESTRRAVSNPTNRERIPRSGRRSQFLPLLHLAIYENALQFVDFETDLTVLHILLTKLVYHLGVNSARFGIPMIYRLQEDIQEIDLPVHKVRIAALCHGYFWVLSERFDFDASGVGRAIQNEVVRRRSKGFWIGGINVPAPPLESVGLPGQTGSQPTWDMATLEKEELLPFDDRSALVECIATSYEESSRSPPASPAASPGRGMSNPILGSTMSPAQTADDDIDLPSHFREQMLTDWSREAVAAALASEVKAESLNGSRSANTTGTQRYRLTINTAAGTNGNGQEAFPSPYGSPRNLRPHSARMADREHNASTTQLRKSSVRSGISPSVSVATSKGGVASVDQLKMVLSGNLSAQAINALPRDEEDDSDESMVSYDYTPSETSFQAAVTQQSEQPAKGAETPKRSGSMSRRGPLSSNPPHQSTPNLDDEDGDESVPPVPPLPNSKSGTTSSWRGESQAAADDVSVHDHAGRSLGRKPSSRAGSLGFQQTSMPEESGRTMDLQELLRGIDSRPGEGSLSNVTKPPY